MYVKFLSADGTSCHGGSGMWIVGEWREVEGELVPCRNAIHACRPEDTPYWVGPAAAEIEFDGEPIMGINNVYGRRARLVRWLPWGAEDCVEFAAWCAERAARNASAYAAACAAARAADAARRVAEAAAARVAEAAAARVAAAYAAYAAHAASAGAADAAAEAAERKAQAEWIMARLTRQPGEHNMKAQQIA